jgi:tetratricopeptide (TPR) repeat protein
MSKRGDNPGENNVIRFPVEAVSKRGHTRVRPDARTRRTRAARMEREGQINMFEDDGDGPAGPRELGQVVPLPLRLSMFEEALLLDESGDERAEQVYLQAIEDDEYAADAWCNLGVLTSHRGDFDRAFECFTQSLTCDPRHSESHYNIGNLYFDMGDLRLARAHYEIAAEIDPDFPNVHFNLGLVTAIAEDYRAAYQAFSRYRDLAPPAEARIATELLDSIRSAMQLS